VPPVREEIAVGKCDGREWIEVHRQAHRLGMPSTATMMFGSIETPAQRIEHMMWLRDLQDETGGFTAFICWPFQPANTRLAPSDGSAPASLRTNALSRLVLDNVPNLQASWVTMGGGVAQASLHMGCNDFGSVMIEENVVSAAGTTFQMDSEEVERHIRDAGFRPARRNMRYEWVGDRRQDGLGASG
jgi:cyclic dehypoxanthinyl futalosine synthase